MVGDGVDDGGERVVGIGAHLVVGAILDGVRREHPSDAGESERLRLRLSGIDEFGRRDEHAGDAPTLQINDVVHTARRATASIGECFDDQRALRGDLVAQVDRSGFRERWLAIAVHLCTGGDQQLLQSIEENVATWLADVEQAHDLALHGAGSWQWLAVWCGAFAGGIEQQTCHGSTSRVTG